MAKSEIGLSLIADNFGGAIVDLGLNGIKTPEQKKLEQNAINQNKKAFSDYEELLRGK